MTLYENKKKILLISLGVVAVGSLGFFGWKEYKKRKEEQEGASANDTSADNGSNVPDIFKSSKSNDSFPLKSGSKGAKVKQLQQALMSKYGKSILPKYGADGIYGSELETALKKKGFSSTVNAKTFAKITGNAVQGIENNSDYLLTTKPTIVWKSKNEWIRVAQNLVLGIPIKNQNGFTLFKSKDQHHYLVKTNSTKTIKCED